MLWLLILIILAFSFFSTAIMSYVAMATPIGPWIETTLVLLGMLLLVPLKKYISRDSSSVLGIITASGGIGGILATACAFSIPTLYFIDKEIFNRLLESPVIFISKISLLAASAGFFGYILAHMWEDEFIEKQNLAFPIGELIYKLIYAKDKFNKAFQLGLGFISTQLLLLSQSIFKLFPEIKLIGEFNFSIFSIPSVNTSLIDVSMFTAIGFITGHVIALPLLIGIIIKIGIIEPLYKIYPSLINLNLFKFLNLASFTLTLNDFIFAFCSGLVIQGVIQSFFKLTLKLTSQAFSNPDKNRLYSFPGQIALIKDTKMSKWLTLNNLVLITFGLFLNLAVLLYSEFSLISLIYLLFATAISVYQLLYIAGKFGIAPLGRFATFVMVPGIIMFGYTPEQVTFVGAFVEIASGVACDVLFGRKLAKLSGINNQEFSYFQILGLIFSSISVGIIFYLLISKFGLGYENQSSLPVTKAAARAFFVTVQKFDLIVMLAGAIFGYILGFIGINPTLALGGVLMPVSISIMLVFGGLLTYLTKDREYWYPLLSGIFASGAIWIIVKALLS